MFTPELASLICEIDLSTPEKMSAFKAWQFDDGTLEGLQKLYEAQQSAQPVSVQISGLTADGDVLPPCR